VRQAITVFLALTAAVVFSLSSVLEQRSTHQVPERRALSPRLILDLLRRRLFLTALAVNVVGSVLQILALHFGSLAVVQPLIVLSLLFAVVIAAFTIRHRPPDRVMLIGAACCAGGVGGFLATARPTGGAAVASPSAPLPLGTALVAMVGACLAAARWGPRRVRPLWLALACGVDFGVNAFLLKIVPATLPAGFANPLRQWPLYMLVVVIPAGFVLNQNAFQAGELIAPVLAVITTADPLVSITLGYFLLHENIASTPTALASETASLAVMTGGIVALAHRAPRLTCQTQDWRYSAHARNGSVSAPRADRQR
jgi:drug/metabolite transporter (DMT)-like permease